MTSMARLFPILFSIVVLAAELSHNHVRKAAEVTELDERACKPLIPSFQNGGFQSGKLSPWSWTWTNHSVPMTAKVVDHGYKSDHSVEIYSNVIPWRDSPSGSQHNDGWFRQHFQICTDQEVHYRVTWNYYQVPGGTTYNDEGLDTRDFEVLITDPGNYTQPLNDFTLYTKYTVCELCSSSKHYPAGKWYEFYGDFYSSGAGDYVIEFRSELAAASYGGKHNVATTVRLDNISIKKAPQNQG